MCVRDRVESAVKFRQKPRAVIATALFAVAVFAVWVSRFALLPGSRIPLVPPAHWTGLARLPLSVDLNHDSRLDSIELVAGEHRGPTIQVKLDGIGSRELKGGFDRGRDGFVYAIDVNRDDNLDLVLEYKDGLSPASVWLGNGKGDFVLASASTPKPDDFYTAPAAPFRPYSSSRSPSSAWTYSVALARTNRSRASKLRIARRRAVADSRKQMFRRETPACIGREILHWLARTINAPPIYSLNA